MDGTKAGGEKSAVLSAGSDAGADPSSSLRAAQQTPVSGAAAAALGAPVAAGEEEDDDDEQMERFYALLANIRALRGAYVASGGGTRKRARRADPPWRPAFRLEDFEEPSPATDVAKRKQRLEADDGETGERRAVVSSSPPRSAVRLNSSSSKRII